MHTDVCIAESYSRHSTEGALDEGEALIKRCESHIFYDRNQILTVAGKDSRVIGKRCCVEAIS
jgi:hypothetical protein